MRTTHLFHTLSFFYHITSSTESLEPQILNKHIILQAIDTQEAGQQWRQVSNGASCILFFF